MLMDLQDDVAPLPPKAFSPERKSLRLVAKKSEEQKAEIAFALNSKLEEKDKGITEEEDTCNHDESEITPRPSIKINQHYVKGGNDSELIDDQTFQLYAPELLQD